MPATSEYEYVKVYEYTPGAGNFGTGNNFTHLWTDDFNSYDTNRWTISEDGSWDQNRCVFNGSSADISGGTLELKLQAPFANTEFVPVTVSVNMSEANIPGNYYVGIAGAFNNWCGNCSILTHQGQGVYSRTVMMPPGSNEFIFTVNNWQYSSGPPQGSVCDKDPCDQFANYGLDIPSGSGPITIPTVCYGECSDCSPCPDNLNLTGNVVNEVHHANIKIESDAVIFGLQNEFKAGQCVELNDGFHAQSGVIFEATIEDCN